MLLLEDSSVAALSETKAVMVELSVGSETLVESLDGGRGEINFHLSGKLFDGLAFNSLLAIKIPVFFGRHFELPLGLI